jgi:hypothetical protein
MWGSFRSRYRAGDWVQIRSKEEILRTLDERGALDNLPFMPEMLALCGQRFRVFASAHKTCDTVKYTGARRLRNAVHLDGVRCDGSGHDGCQARCLIFWKEEWLLPVQGGRATVDSESRASERPGHQATRGCRCDESTLARVACDRAVDTLSPTYSCQATRLFDATTALPSWHPMQYAADVRSGNVALAEAVKLLSLALLYNMRRIGIGWRFWCYVYERFHEQLMGAPSPYARGSVPEGTPTPTEELDLRPGERVEVRPYAEILPTLNQRNRNRGLSFDKEMVRYCGQRFRVGARVRTIINETTGKMIRLPTSSVILEGTYCTSRYSERRLLCPRRIVPYWREVWLRRVEGTLPQGPGNEDADR